MHGVRQRIGRIASKESPTREILMNGLEDKGQIHAVGRAQAAVCRVALPGEGVGPGLASGFGLAFQNLVGGHSEERVQMEQRRGKLRRRKRHQGRVSGQIGLNGS